MIESANGSGSSSGNGSAQDSDAALGQARADEGIATEDGSGDGSGPGVDNSDPMASIRPRLPVSPPLVAPTLELSRLSGEHDDSQLEDATLERLLPRATEGEALETHHSGPVIHVAEPGTPASSVDPGLAYRLHERIGAGGMGEVWRATQRELGRPVALKRLRSSKQAPDIIKLFKSEARLTAMLDHPNIVTVHELGHDQDGRVFYTMKLIDGHAWSEVIGAGRRKTGSGEIVKVELRDHIDILIEVSQAIAFAHSRGVIHRDIKPGNVMIGDYGEVRVLDWGLAVAMTQPQALDHAPTWTLAELPKSALVCGTPAYMSPETASAQRHLIGPPTDVYLLGAVLFHVLYSRPPHRGKTVAEVIRRAKVNDWSMPSEVSGRLKPWDALLRPVINRALATDPAQRYADAGEFGEALREAVRNYESAKVASRAQEQLLAMELRAAKSGSTTEDYQQLAALIARLEGALESWPRNLTARQTLAQARLELAALALEHGDLHLARLGVEAYQRMPPLPEPEPVSEVRRLTVHPVDGTLINAPRPTDSLIAAGTSNQWVSSAADLGQRNPSASVLAKTIGAADVGSSRDPGSGRGRIGSTPSGLRLSSVASVEIQDSSDEAMLGEEQAFEAMAARLRAVIGERERLARRRRISLRVVASVVALLLAAVGVSVLAGQLALRREHRRAEAERNKLSEVLLDETANTVEAQIDVVFEPVDAALATTLAWARAGELDDDDPAVLNRYYMPLLTGVDAVTSTLRADSLGNEYMLLLRPTGWRTRSTTPNGPRAMREWSENGELVDSWVDHEPYHPHVRPWYVGGAALRGAANVGGLPPVFWTEPYPFFTTKEVGISVSAPVESVSGREFVLAFDIKLGDLSQVTIELPHGISQGQVFVLDEQLRVLALPRELAGVDAQQREQLLLRPLAELDDAVISSAAVRAWQQRGDDGPFRLELGDGIEDNFWVGFRQVDKPHRPRVWIGVVVPQSHFLD